MKKIQLYLKQPQDSNAPKYRLVGNVRETTSVVAGLPDCLPINDEDAMDAICRKVVQNAIETGPIVENGTMIKSMCLLPDLQTTNDHWSYVTGIARHIRENKNPGKFDQKNFHIVTAYCSHTGTGDGVYLIVDRTPRTR